VSAAPEIGVALLSVGFACGMSAGGLVADRFGFGVFGRHRVGGRRCHGDRALHGRQDRDPAARRARFTAVDLQGRAGHRRSMARVAPSLTPTPGWLPGGEAVPQDPAVRHVVPGMPRRVENDPALAAFPADLGDFFGEFGSGVRTTVLGGVQPGSPALAGLGAGSWVAFGSTALAQKVLLGAMPALAGIAMYRAMARQTGSPASAVQWSPPRAAGRSTRAG